MVTTLAAAVGPKSYDDYESIDNNVDISRGPPREKMGHTIDIGDSSSYWSIISVGAIIQYTVYNVSCALEHVLSRPHDPSTTEFSANFDGNLSRMWFS